MEHEHFCERCGEKLNPQTMVWLELSNITGLYHSEGRLPAGDVSQGCFVFGIACARKVLANGGKCQHIRSRKR